MLLMSLIRRRVMGIQHTEHIAASRYRASVAEKQVKKTAHCGGYQVVIYTPATRVTTLQHKNIRTQVARAGTWATLRLAHTGLGLGRRIRAGVKAVRRKCIGLRAIVHRARASHAASRQAAGSSRQQRQRPRGRGWALCFVLFVRKPGTARNTSAAINHGDKRHKKYAQRTAQAPRCIYSSVVSSTEGRQKKKTREKRKRRISAPARKKKYVRTFYFILFLVRFWAFLGKGSSKTRENKLSTFH
jgi:hypothetical protein